MTENNTNATPTTKTFFAAAMAYFPRREGQNLGEYRDELHQLPRPVRGLLPSRSTADRTRDDNQQEDTDGKATIEDG